AEFLDGKSKTFLLDCFVFPGNSGGPAILRGEGPSNGDAKHSRADLIGVVQAYKPYSDIAISLQTKRPRIVFEENSGLAVVLPVDLIDEMLKPDAEKSDR